MFISFPLGIWLRNVEGTLVNGFELTIDQVRELQANISSACSEEAVDHRADL